MQKIIVVCPQLFPIIRVVGHQYVGVDGAAELIGELLEVLKVELVVLFRVETDRAIVAALDDVPRDAGEGKTGAAGHECDPEVEETAGQQKIIVV